MVLPQKVVVLGLDMGDGDAIRDWSAQGLLPNLARLIGEGTWLELESTAAVLHTSTWPTFATGCLPGRHGVYYPYQPAPGHQRARHVGPDQYHCPSFWSLADQHGKRCFVYDVPETFPEAGFKGPAIFEWGTWAWYGKRLSQPAALLDELKGRFGRYPLKLEAKRLGLEFPARGMLERRLLDSIEHKRRSLQWLMDRADWDLAVAAFGETHPAGHYLWPEGAHATADCDAKDLGPFLRVYEAIDRAIGELKNALPQHAALLVVSGDGVRANYCGWHLLPAVLERLGFTVPRGAAPGETGTKAPLLSLGGVKALVPQGARRWIADHLPWWLRDRIGASIQAEQIDWTKTRAFALPTDLEGYVRINLKGREPEGIVEPAEYDGLCRRIAADLEALVNPATGRPAVKRVWVRNEVYPGDAQEHLPDLMVAWDDSAPIAALQSSGAGTVEQQTPDPRTGTHSTRGFLLASGPGIPSGLQGSARLVDVAPTVLALLGLSGGWTMDGEPLRDAWQGPRLSAGPNERAREYR